MKFFSKKATVQTEKTDKKAGKPVWHESLDAGVFALFAATLIRSFACEAYTIPSGSMEGTMLVHDYLFVSKMATAQGYL
jgi:signal peptidase I